MIGKNTRIKAAALLGAFAFGVMTADMARADARVLLVKDNSNHMLTVEKGKPKTVRTQTSFYEIVVGDPEIANVQPLTNRSFYVLGIAAGTTGIAMFDENKRLIGSLDVEVSVDTSRLRTAIRQNVPDADIKVTTTNGQVVLSGEAPDQVSADRAEKIASKFAGEDEDIINSVNITSSQQVQLNVRFVEINRNSGQELGLNINRVAYRTGGGPTAAGAATSSLNGVFSGNILGGFVAGGVDVDIAIKAMEDRGVARRLAEPNLIARSGETASFLAGGEYPIAITDDDGRVTVEYKKFGVGLEFTPSVLKDGLIQLEIAPEVSSLQAETLANGFPILSVRRAQTSVDLKSGQSFMMAGLFQAENEQIRRNLPGARKLPIIGALLSSKDFQRKETDLVMIVTPHLVRPIEPGTPSSTPLDAARPATEEESALLKIEEVKRRGAASDRTSGHILTLEIGG